MLRHWKQAGMSLNIVCMWNVVGGFFSIQFLIEAPKGVDVSGINDLIFITIYP